MDRDLKGLIFKAVGLAMGVATLVLNIMGKINIESSVTLLSIGLICLALNGLENKKD